MHPDHKANKLYLSCIRWGYLSRAGLWDKSHLMRQIEKYVLFSWNSPQKWFICIEFLSCLTEVESIKFEYSLPSGHINTSWRCRYADIYTSRVSNFLHYTPFMYFRSQEQVFGESIMAFFKRVSDFYINWFVGKTDIDI